MSKKAVLGRGLNALIPQHESEESPNRTPQNPPSGRLYHIEDRVRMVGRVADIDVDLIRPNPYQPRTDFDSEALEELAASMRQLGVIQPVTVRAVEGGEFEIISGERRLRAARMAGLKQIPAFVREADTEEMLEMAIVENVQREALNPIEVALGYQRLMEECGLTQEDVAQKVGKNRATVANLLRLLKLPPHIQVAVRDGRISAGHARALLGIDDEKEQTALLQLIELKDLSVREVEDRVRRFLEERAAKQQETSPEEPVTRFPDANQLELRAFADRLRSRFSTQIQIKHRPNGSGGRIEIAYYSNEDLERLLEMLLQEASS